MTNTRESTPLMRDNPASAPQSIKVNGAFVQGTATEDSLNHYFKFTISELISVSSSLTRSVGPGDTLQLQMSPGQKHYVMEFDSEPKSIFQLILQERIVPGFDEAIYSLKDIRKIR